MIIQFWHILKCYFSLCPWKFFSIKMIKAFWMSQKMETIYHDTSGFWRSKERYFIEAFRWNWLWKASLHETNLLFASLVILLVSGKCENYFVDVISNSTITTKWKGTEGQPERKKLWANSISWNYYLILYIVTIDLWKPNKLNKLEHPLWVTLDTSR